MNVKLRMLLVLALAGCSQAATKTEDCNNKVDDDGNGKIDCADPECAFYDLCQAPKVDAGFYGTCGRCGFTCSAQAECYEFGLGKDTPLPYCTSGRCQSLNVPVALRFEIDTTGSWPAVALRSSQTFVVRKLGQDGAAVSCAVVQAAAAGKTQADVDQLQRSGKFQFQGFDVTPLNVMGGGIFTLPFVNAGTGKDFLIFTELWAGPRDSNTSLPTGNRLGFGCFESGDPVAEITAVDDCSPSRDGGTCRVVRLKMPAPP